MLIMLATHVINAHAYSSFYAVSSYKRPEQETLNIITRVFFTFVFRVNGHISGPFA